MAEEKVVSGPDFRKGIPIRDLPDGGIVRGRVDTEEAIVLRRGDEFFAIGAHCTHYHGPLADGLVAGDTIRCPWHHACFSLRTGEAVACAGVGSVPCWRVEHVNERIVVREKLTAPGPRKISSSAKSAPRPSSAQLDCEAAAAWTTPPAIQLAYDPDRTFKQIQA